MIMQLKDQLLPCHVPEYQSATTFQCVSLSDVYCSSKKTHSPHHFYSAMFMGLSSINVFDSSIPFRHSVAVVRLSTCKMCHVQVCPSPFLVTVGRSWEIQTMSTCILSCGWGAFNRALRNIEGTCNVPPLEAANSASLLSSVSAMWWQFFTFPSIGCCSVIVTIKQNMFSVSHSYLWLLWVLQ